MKTLDKDSTALFDRREKVARLLGKLQKEKQALNHSLLKAFGRNRKAVTKDGRELYRQTVLVAAHKVAEYSYQAIRVTSSNYKGT